MENHTKHKLGMAAGLWLAVMVSVALYLLAELREAHASWGYEPWIGNMWHPAQIFCIPGLNTS